MRKVESSLITKVLNSIPTNVDNTYEKDGLLYCTKCHTLRVTKDIMPIFNRHMPVMCECMKEKKRKEAEADAHKEKMEQLDKIRSASLLKERYKDVTFGNTDISVGESFINAYTRCKRYCEISDEALRNGYGMYIYCDKSGTGKTHLTACMCNELISQRKQCLFTNFLEISKLIRSTWNKKDAEAEAVIRRISQVDYLFIDDLGTEIIKRNGEDNWLQEQIYDIINSRYGHQKPTIFTSNYSLNELITDRGMWSKTVDRINEMATAIIKLQGTSYRAKKKPQTAPF